MKRKLGPTGRYPHGKLNSADEGEIAISISAEKGKIVVNLGAPIAWFAMEPAQAREMGRAIIRAVRRILEPQKQVPQ